jgi:hypothetical protein
MPGPYTFDVNTPAGSETRRLGDNRLRELKSALDMAFKDGPMSGWPTTAHCSLGWPRIFRYDTLAGLQANAVASPYQRLGYVSADGANNGLYLELSTGWTLITGA